MRTLVLFLTIIGMALADKGDEDHTKGDDACEDVCPFGEHCESSDGKCKCGMGPECHKIDRTTKNETQHGEFGKHICYKGTCHSTEEACKFDEKYCEPVKCTTDQWACTDGKQCIEMAQHCDKQEDCEDGSDDMDGCEDGKGGTGGTVVNVATTTLDEGEATDEPSDDGKTTDEPSDDGNATDEPSDDGKTTDDGKDSSTSGLRGGPVVIGVTAFLTMAMVMY